MAINFEKIQRELAETESFLRTSIATIKTQDNATAGSSLTRTSLQKSSILDVAPASVDSFWMESSTTGRKGTGTSSADEVDDTAGFGRYADPTERERLISRLLEEHNLKSGPESVEVFHQRG